MFRKSDHQQQETLGKGNQERMRSSAPVKEVGDDRGEESFRQNLCPEVRSQGLMKRMHDQIT